MEAKEAFSVDEGVLHAGTDLYWNHLDAFETACARLLDSGRSAVELDLTDVNFISSSFLGCLNSLLLRAGKMRMRVVLTVSQDVLWLFDIMGSRRNLEMRVV